MFSRARWRLTLFFDIVVAVILIFIGVAVLSASRTALFDGVNDDLEARAQRELRPLGEQLLQRLRRGDQLQDPTVPKALTAGGYFFALVREDGTILAKSANIDEAGLAGLEDIGKATPGDPTFVDTKSSDGDNLRVYVRTINGPREKPILLEVGRSTEPEREALRRLISILIAGGIAGLTLSVGGGYWLAGYALKPIKVAMGKQQEFVADASHELRTPLSLIRANAEILKREADKQAGTNTESLQDIISETDRLASLVSRMLTLARADSGKTVMEAAPVDMGGLARDTVREMRALAADKGITIEAPALGPVVVEGDELRLRELLTILLDNAMKYSDKGARVDVWVGLDRGKAVLRVSDNGRGIPKEALPRIFDRFYRADRARSREMGGTGLGLAIAKWIVDTHKGHIRVESEIGLGTTITVELPAAHSK